MKISVDFNCLKKWHAGSWLEFIKTEAIARGFDWQVSDTSSAIVRTTMMVQYVNARNMPMEKLFLYILWAFDGLVPHTTLKSIDFISAGLGAYFGRAPVRRVTKSKEQAQQELAARLARMEQSKKRLVKWTKEHYEK